MNIVFHIDVNNAFLSWTAVDLLRNGYKEDIRNIPSIIGGDKKKRTGIVLAKSNIAKKKGVVTAEAIFMANKKCPNLKLFPPDYNLYKKESDKLYNYLSTFTPDIERYSIDECFLDLTGTNYLYDNYLELAKEISSYIFKNFGYTVNIGIANNRLCAKMASDFEKPNKIHTLFMDEIESKMWPLPIEDLFMVGKSSSKILRNIGINTIGDLARYDYNLLYRYFKNNTNSLINSANGIDNTKIGTYIAKDKSISYTQTFETDIDDINYLKDTLYYQADNVGRTIRKDKKYAFLVAVIFKTDNFVSYSKQITLDNPINATEDIYNCACKVLKTGWRGEPLRLIGIRLGQFTSSKVRQCSLFDDNSDRVDKIQDAIDKINDKYGNNTVKVAKYK